MFMSISNFGIAPLSTWCEKRHVIFVLGPYSQHGDLPYSPPYFFPYFCLSPQIRRQIWLVESSDPWSFVVFHQTSPGNDTIPGVIFMVGWGSLFERPAKGINTPPTHTQHILSIVNSHSINSHWTHITQSRWVDPKRSWTCRHPIPRCGLA